MNASIHFPLAREDAAQKWKTGGTHCASIHFPLAREDLSPLDEINKISTLQSTSLLRGKTCTAALAARVALMLQSTSLLRGKTNCGFHFGVVECASIHFPLAREDPVEKELPPNAKQASIHFPLAREDIFTISYIERRSRFNPLPSCEGRQEAYQKKQKY